MSSSRSSAQLCGMFAMLCLWPSVVAAQPVQNQPPANAPRYRYWTTNWSFEDINVGRLLDRLRGIGIDVPIAAEGDVSVNFSVSIPLNGLREGRAYRFNGTIAANRLRLEQLELAGLRTNARYEAGTLTLSDLTTRWLDQRRRPGTTTRAGGELAGEASLGLVPRGALTTSLSARSLAIGPLYDLILSASNQPRAPVLEGTVGGLLDASVPLQSLRDPLTWTMDADIQAVGLSLADVVPLSVDTGPVSLRAGQLTASELRVASPVNSQIRMIASLSADLRGERRFEFTARGNDLPLQSFASLASLSLSSAATGNLDLEARGSGSLGGQELAAARWEVQGRVASPQLSAFGLQLGLIQHAFEFDSQRLRLTRLNDQPSDRVVVERVAADYVIGEDAVSLDNVDAAFFGGGLKGSARFARSEQGTHRVQLQWNEIRPQFNTGYLMPRGIPVSLQTSGEVNWTLPAASADQLASHEGVAKISVDQLLLGTANVGNAQLTLQATAGELDVQGEGELFGGRFSVETTTQLTAVASWLDLSSTSTGFHTQGKVEFNRIRLSRAADVIQPRSNRRMDGFLSGEVVFGSEDQLNGERLPEARGLLALDNVVLDGRLLTRRLNADLYLDRDRLTIRSLRGEYAGGQIDTVGLIGLSDKRGVLQVRLAAIDASRALMPVSTAASQYAGGLLSGRLTIETGPRLRARGAVELRNSELFSMSAGNAHAAVSATAENDLSRWTLVLHSIESEIERGRITGNAEVRSSASRPGAFDLRSDWQARRVDFAGLLKSAGGGDRSYARGNLDGSLTLNGTGIRSAVDLTGRFAAELDGSEARAIPGLISAQAYLGALSLASTRVDEGRIQGSIGAGVARIDEFWLVGQRLRVFADGRVQIPSGRMDVSAVISTSSFDVENAAVATLAEQLAIGAAPPVAAFVEINRLLSNRTLYVDILGPIADPRLYLKPLHTLESGITRFFLRRGAGAILPVAATGGVLANGQDR